MSGRIFQVVFHEVSHVGVLDLATLLVLTSHLKGDASNLEVRDLGLCGCADLLGPGKEIGLAHIAVINPAIFGKRISDVAVAQVQLFYLGQ